MVELYKTNTNGCNIKTWKGRSTKKAKAAMIYSTN